MVSWCLNTCIFHMVVNSSKESLVPRNSTSTLIRSQYWDWWRLPARKVRNLKQNVYNIYMEEVNPCTYTGNHPVPLAGNPHDPTMIPKKVFQNLSCCISGEKSRKKEASGETIFLKSTKIGQQRLWPTNCKWNTTFLYPIIQKQWSDKIKLAVESHTADHWRV